MKNFDPQLIKVTMKLEEIMFIIHALVTSVATLQLQYTMNTRVCSWVSPLGPSSLTQGSTICRYTHEQGAEHNTPT